MDTQSWQFLEAKREALTRRADKLIGWLGRPDYTTYDGDESVTHLIKTLDLIVWALEKSLPVYNWRHYKVRFADARGLLTEITEIDDQRKKNFNSCIEMTIATLRSYIDFVQSNDLRASQEEQHTNYI